MTGHRITDVEFTTLIDSLNCCLRWQQVRVTMWWLWQHFADTEEKAVSAQLISRGERMRERTSVWWRRRNWESCRKSCRAILCWSVIFEQLPKHWHWWAL